MNGKRTLIIDDIGVSITIKWYYNLCGKRIITLFYDNLRGRPIERRGYQGKLNAIQTYAYGMLAKAEKH